MESLSIDNFHAKMKKTTVALVKGKEIAIQLQTLLNNPVENYGPVSAEEMAMQIFRSFSDTLSMLTSSTDSAQISAADGGGSACSAESKKKTGVKDRRGCYKRRRSTDSWVRELPTVEDGYAWRKYGQKNILNSEYPRCYFRCTHKPDGCKATKQVQRIKGDPISYQTTYFNRHTCAETLRPPQLIVESDPMEPNLISFQANITSKQDQHSSNPMIISSVKQEDTQSEDVSDDHEAKSTLEDPWQDIIELEPLGYKPVWAPYQEEVASGFHSGESTTLHELDMEVNQLSDIDNFHYFDEI